MNKNEQTATMYESIPAVAELNKVPGFNPLKLLRRIISPENGEEMLQLDLRYKKLWFRLANPKGRIRLNALRITEQMAIYEAQVFWSAPMKTPLAALLPAAQRKRRREGSISRRHSMRLWMRRCPMQALASSLRMWAWTQKGAVTGAGFLSMEPPRGRKQLL